MKTVRIVLLGAAFAASLPVIAWAGHGKVGLWEISVQTSMPGMPAMPDMSQLPPEARARMAAMGVHLNGNTITTSQCMTPADVNRDHPDMSRNQECKAVNVKAYGQRFSADLVCNGHMKGTGHVDFLYESPEHFTANESMHGTVEGHPVSNVTKIMGRWISADCGKVRH